MLTAVHPKLPMRNKAATTSYYTTQLGFTVTGTADYPEYLMLQKDKVELHFFLHETLNPLENDGQVYIRCSNIKTFYDQLLQNNVVIHPNGPLQVKPWGQMEFSLLDPDHNLLTFGEGM